MITVCLADGIIPEQNQKLRRIIRRSFLICENVFKVQKGLLKELSNYVIEHLGLVYPELERNVKQIQQIIDYEEEVYKTVRKSATDEWTKLAKNQPELEALDINENPSLVTGYKEIRTTNPKTIDDKLAFKLYDTFGLDEESISALAKALNMPFDITGFHKQLELAKIKSKEQHSVSVGSIYDQLKRAKIPKTDRSRLYSYVKIDKKYNFPDLEVKVLRIIKNGEFVSQVPPEIFCSIVLDKSHLYTEAGGQISDRGMFLTNGAVFEITESEDCNGYILHKGFLHLSKNNHFLVEGTAGTLKVDSDFRLKTMRNHTAVHLLNSALKKVKGATCQKSSRVTQTYLNLDVGIFGEKISLDEVGSIEKTIKKLIQSQLPVNITEINSQELSSFDDVTLVPGEVYPETGIRVVEVKSDAFLSREPCCGTHVLNTGDLGDFCVVSVKSLGRGTASIHCVTGERAKIAKANGMDMLNNVETLEKSVKDNIDEPHVLNHAVASLKQHLNYNVEDSNILPVVVKQQCLDILQRVTKQVKESGRRNLKELVEVEMRNAVESNTSKTKTNHTYLVHYLRSSSILENISLHKATRLCPDIPVLVISYCDSVVKARCCIPQKLRSDTFDAEKWLTQTVAATFKSGLVPPKGYDPTLVSNMKSKKIRIEDWDPLLQEGLEAARKYVEEHL